MGIFVVSQFLFLLGDVNGNFNCLFYISNGSVEFEGPLWFFWDVVGFTH